MERQVTFWTQRILSICYKPLNFIYTYMLLLRGLSVGRSATNGAYVNLKIEILNTYVKPHKKLQLKL